MRSPNPVTLAVGANVIKAVVTAEDTTTMKTYMVTVTREATPNADPTFTDGDSTSRAFDETIGDVAVSTAAGIGTSVDATDTNAGDTLTYSLEGTDAARFGIVSTSGQLRTKVGEQYSYEARMSYAVTVKVVDGHGGFDTIDVTINVNDEDESPVQPAAPSVSSASTTSLSVDWAAPSNIGRPAIDDYDLRYRQGTSGGWTNGPQNETGTSATIMSLTANTLYQVQVRATNNDGDSPWSLPGEGQTNTAGNSAPTFSASFYTRSVAENSPAVTAVGDAVTATDADGDPLTYTLEGTDAASFTIDSTSGQIRTKSGVTYDRASYTVIVKADDGNGSDTATVTITLTTGRITPPPEPDPVGPPTPPSALTATAGDQAVELSWRRPADDGGAQIVRYEYRQQDGDGPFGAWQIIGADPPPTTHRVTGLMNGTRYTFQVRAVNASGPGPAAAVTGTPVTTPGVPQTAEGGAGRRAGDADLGSPVE